MSTLKVFNEAQENDVKLRLAEKVASMMGRKWEEGDWSEVYCKAMGVPDTGWSNLHIDVNHSGLGVEFKMLRVPQLGDSDIEKICGTTLMHPSATRSIRINDLEIDADEAMRDIFKQYCNLIANHTAAVKLRSGSGTADMRIGWLLWEKKLREFLYWEERMVPPEAGEYYAKWNDRPAMGTRKASRSLWIFDRVTRRKRYSVTTSAGVKIQPYFDVPAPDDQYLYRFRVQSEPVGTDGIILWVTTATASELENRVGAIDGQSVSDMVQEVSDMMNQAGRSIAGNLFSGEEEDRPAVVPVEVSRVAFRCLVDHWAGVNDDHSVRLFLDSLERTVD